MKKSEKEKIKIPCELALLMIIVLNSFGVAIMSKSGFGISSISSVPYVFSQAFPFLTFGTWNYLFQTALIAALMILARKWNGSYLISFLVGIAFGKMLDVHEAWIAFLPDAFGFRILWFLLGFAVISFGICLSNHCMLPIVPTDLFPRELSGLICKKYKNVKTTFDLCCLTTTLLISLLLLRHISGVGIGTVICAFTTGKAVSVVEKHLLKHVQFYRITGKNRIHPAVYKKAA